MKYMYCTDCHAVFPKADCDFKTSDDPYSPGEIPVCPECHKEEIEEANYCPCGMGIRPPYIAKDGEKKWTGLCENCEDSLNDIKKEVRALFPNIKPIDETTIEEYLIDNLFPRLTPMEWKDGGWEL